MHLNIQGERVMQMPESAIGTMDSVSKCWRTIEPNSPSLLTNESEGGSWAFCEECVAQIPKNLQEFLFFFHKLKTNLNDLRGFVVPSGSVTLGRSRMSKTEISHLVWHKHAESTDDPNQSDAGDDIDLNRVMRERNSDSSGDIKVQIDPIRLRLGTTGATYKQSADGREHAMNFMVLVVTWARNFDMLAYIKVIRARPALLCLPR